MLWHDSMNVRNRIGHISAGTRVSHPNTFTKMIIIYSLQQMSKIPCLVLCQINTLELLQTPTIDRNHSEDMHGVAEDQHDNVH
jgi:hypothetical protein